MYNPKPTTPIPTPQTQPHLTPHPSPLTRTQASVMFYEGQPEPWSDETGLHPVPLPYFQYCAAVIFYRKSFRMHRMLRLAIAEADRLHPLGYLDQVLNPKPETRNPKPETRNPEPGTLSHSDTSTRC